MCARPVNLLVFREDRKQVGSQSAITDLLRACREDVLSALLLAGEIECGVADAEPDLASAWQQVTDSLADALLGRVPLDSDRICALIQLLPVPKYLTISPAEGFAYYALHPMAYADVLNVVGELPGEIAVVGIRSVGTTLSAITSAAALKRGLRSSRITVRPNGHPYNRQTNFTPEQMAWIAKKESAKATFLVVDEGPGLSGSSFISVAEALVGTGVPVDRITLICGHKPDFTSLRADNASSRAQQFRWVPVHLEPYRPRAAQMFVGAGQWRRALIADEASWPASWTDFERMKYLAASAGDNPDLLKFMGFGRYGAEAVRREEVVAEAGFGPAAHEMADGFAHYPWVEGRPMRTEDLSENVLSRLAEYCAFRARSFSAELHEISPLQLMAEHNLHELNLDLPVSLRFEHPVIADARMQPHEWILTKSGQMLKTDSGTHGNDHFFPGPADIAWDLAGAIVEWGMGVAAQEFFIATYRRTSGDDPRGRLADYITAYAAFRCAYCTMAANASDGTEQVRLEKAAVKYAARLAAPLQATAA